MVLYNTSLHCIIKITIELHAPTNLTQKLKLMGRGGQFTYIPTLPLMQGSHYRYSDSGIRF